MVNKTYSNVSLNVLCILYLYLCAEQCYLRGEMYDHGESVNPKECVECECLDGLMKCKRIDPETMCPPLSCSPQEQFSVPGNCCKFCKGKTVR